MSLKGGLSALANRIPGVQSSPKMGDRDDDDVRNTHSWDDNSPSIKQRILPSSPKNRFRLYALLILAFGWFISFGFRLVPFSGANALMLGILSSVPLAYYKGRTDGIAWYKKWDKLFLHNAKRGVEVRLGKAVDTVENDRRATMFEWLKGAHPAGYRPRFAQIKDLFGASSDVLLAKAGRDGDIERGDANARLLLDGNFLGDTTTDTLGRCIVAGFSGTEKRPNTEKYDEAVEPPNLLDNGAGAQVLSHVQDIETNQIPALERDKRMADRRARESEAGTDERVRQRLDELVIVLQTLQPGQRSQLANQVDWMNPPASDADPSVLDDIDDRANDQMEDN